VRDAAGGLPALEIWLAARDDDWRAEFDVVALDPSAPFAAAIRRLLPHATIVVDHWHLVRLANQAVTEGPLANRSVAAAANSTRRRTGGCCSPPVIGCPRTGRYG
jgi:transposase